MKTSVIIPAYNEGQYLGKCLESFTYQTVKPFEIIVVDNNSTDDTVAVSKKFPVKVIHEKKQGIAFARNAGFDAAQGDVIARCDADTIVSPDWVERIQEHFEGEKIDALSGPVRFYDAPQIVSFIMSSKLLFHSLRFIQGYDTLIGFNMAITKEMWLKVRSKACTDSSIVHEDIDLAIHVAQNGGKTLYDPDLISFSSARRIVKNPSSFFLEYPLMLHHTLRRHNIY